MINFREHVKVMSSRVRCSACPQTVDLAFGQPVKMTVRRWVEVLTKMSWTVAPAPLCRKCKGKGQR